MRIFSILYWLGLLIALVGLGLRFELGWWRAGLAVALVGLGLLLSARGAEVAMRGNRKIKNLPRS